MASIPWSFHGLKEYIDKWTPELASELHTTHDKAHNDRAQYVWEEFSYEGYSGFVHYGPLFATCYRSDGIEYVLTKDTQSAFFYFDNDARATSLLNSLANKIDGLQTVSYTNLGLGKFKKATINDERYYLYGLTHPGGFGIPYALYLTSLGSLDNYIGQMTLLLTAIRQVVEDPDNKILGYPSIKVPWLIKNESGLYWRQLFDWSRKKETLYYQQVGELQKLLQHLAKNGLTEVTNIEEEARLAWATALNI